MPNLSANGSSNWYRCDNYDGVHIKGANSFGGGTLTLQQRVEGTTYDSLDSAGAAVTYTAAFDDYIRFKPGDVLRVTLSGATSPDLDYIITGAVDIGA
jgi:predicted acyl esterase